WLVMVGGAAWTAAAGVEVEISPEGVFDLAKTPADALAAGAVQVVPAIGVVAAAGAAGVGGQVVPHCSPLWNTGSTPSVARRIASRSSESNRGPLYVRIKAVTAPGGSGITVSC